MESVITLRAKVYITLQASSDTLSVLSQLPIRLPVRLCNIIHVLIVAVLAMVMSLCLDRVMPHSIEAVDEFPSLQRHFRDLCWFDVFAVILPAPAAPQVVHLFTIPITIRHRKRTN